MLELNKVMLVGRLTRDPEYRSTSTGRAVASLRLAVNRRSYNRESGSYQDSTVFVDVDAWERQAEFAKNYLHKGSGVFIEGRLKQDEWQDRETGQQRSKLGVVAERVIFAETKAEAERHQGGGGGYQAGGGYSGGQQPPQQGGGFGQSAPQSRPAPAPARESGPPEPTYDGGGENTDDDLPF